MTWKRATATGEPPSPRRAHSAVFSNGKLYIFGGGDGKKALNDLHSLTIGESELAWAKLATTGTAPPVRAYHTASVVGQSMIVIGGSDGTKCFSDISILNLDTLAWRQVTPPKLISRLSHSVRCHFFSLTFMISIF